MVKSAKFYTGSAIAVLTSLSLSVAVRADTVDAHCDIYPAQQDTDTRGSELNWCNVRFPNSGATGWIHSDFIIFSDGGE